ncbi:MAG TPA: asparagine synthase-related protein [Gemmatimonadota bacterium]|nr:asparagine synthase-related protein [Gemmatimonadota bacterium]
MGAIAVYLSRSGSADPEVAERMLGAAPHRGRCIEVEELGGALLGVVNTPDWRTATLARDGTRVAVFGGTLDNVDDLRAELAREVDPRRLATPAALLLAAFARWGNGAVARLRGSFTGALTDGVSVTCFRDQFGTRPLVYHDGPSGFYAGTEVKQVLAGAPISREPDLEHLYAILFGGLEWRTSYRGVGCIPQAAITTVGSRPGVERTTYWDPAVHVETSSLGPAEAVEGTLDALDRAVRRVLTGQDAILLSGGLDSPALAAFAAEARGPRRHIEAVTSIYPDQPTADEHEWTEMAASHLGLPLHPYVAEAGSMDDVEHWVGLLDGPVAVFSIPESAEAYEAARSVGARTVLTGELAEFLFENRHYLLGHLLSHGRLRAAMRVVAGLRRRGMTYRRIAGHVVEELAPTSLMEGYRRLRGGEPRPNHRTVPPWVDESEIPPRPTLESTSDLGPRRRWRFSQTSPFRGRSIGFEADEICAAACGVEARRPFADVDLWEFVLSLPAEVKFPDESSKPLLRKAMRGVLPDALIDRKDKTYFDEFHLATADYPTLKRLLVGSPHALSGIRYEHLGERLESGDMGIYELQWARNVARVHAFLDQW